MAPATILHDDVLERFLTIRLRRLRLRCVLRVVGTYRVELVNCGGLLMKAKAKAEVPTNNLNMSAAKKL